MNSGETLTIQQALKRAWVIYLVLLAFPFVLTLAVLAIINEDTTPAVSGLAQAWFILALASLAIGVPASFFVRSRIFKAYWTGSVVSPRDYLLGMCTVWFVVEAAGVFSLIGCLLSHSITPNILPALVAFLLFTPFWPSGEAMVRAVGAEDDSAVFKHPR